MKTIAALTFAVIGTIPLQAMAFPIASTGDGLNVVVNSTTPVIATYEGNSAAFSNNLYLMLDASGNPGDDGNLLNDLFIFNNQTSPVGSTVNLGSFAIGSELRFRLFVTNTGNNFYTGAATRNPDGRIHARVEGNFQPNVTLVSFEDLFNGPFDFNDLSFSFTNTRSGPPTNVPLPASLALLGLGLVGIGGMKRTKGLS
jgi:hypothetical protein